MNKAFALAVLMSAATMGTAAYARETGSMVKPANDVAVVFTDPEIDNSAKRLDIPDAIVHPTDAMVHQAQAELREDGALRAALTNRHVELNNVVAIDTAADGGRIVYVR